ncbi:RAMP superfamily CRISPR-associated protein [cf. Phormidesmis sp. LEGE 11477]|uniref:RAMP superfamily CRISPR-associated protein n=1 Tax=cf. Phormidesmis sp. LEGE 11477 TaxID=1828680 RepID=UPI001880F66A|nr:RAMP superfamily CRISPR-associated protein [cf. Phormidesmis sp. LEGE 11477]MBE9063113.1 CRISPR-associated protein [cf. Phormidesmis sp. LEGE 11477]
MVSNRPRRPVSQSYNTDDLPPKPYELVSFPKRKPVLKAPIGHHRYIQSGYHGTLDLSLRVKTALHVSTGITALGSDVGQKVPLIKTMTQGHSDRLVIQGSSLKGCIRAIYEAITNSTLAVVSNRYKQKMPRERLPCRRKDSLCPASQVFGALDWQGLVHFTDAECVSKSAVTGFMPSLYRPRPDQRKAYFDSRGNAAGRKFYHHAREAIDGGNRGTPVQQAGAEYTFKTSLQFLNLSQAQLGTLLISLGQDPDYPMALKLGGGKPVGLGTVQVMVTEAEVMQDVRDRYTQYEAPAAAKLTGEALATFVQESVKAAHREKLVEEAQLGELSEVLKWPTNRDAPTGMY